MQFLFLLMSSCSIFFIFDCLIIAAKKIFIGNLAVTSMGASVLYIRLLNFDSAVHLVHCFQRRRLPCGSILTGADSLARLNTFKIVLLLSL